MFDHIYFSTWGNVKNYSADDIRAFKEYNAFAKDYPQPNASDNDYLIQGTFHFLLPRPYSDSSSQTASPDAFIRMQSFSYGKMYEHYYTQRRNYASYLLLFTYDGEGLLRYEGQEYSLKKGDVFFIDCRKYHDYRTVGSMWEHSDLHLQGRWVEQFYEEYQFHQHPVFHFSQIFVYQNALEKALLAQTGNQPHWAARASHEFENLLFLLAEEILPGVDPAEIPESLQLLRIYLEHNFTKNLTLDEMSAFCGISKYHLCREFKRCIGFSPREYMIKLRVSQAQLMLQTSSLPCYKIGILCGFDNEANFIRQFKKCCGTTPADYRRHFCAPCS